MTWKLRYRAYARRRAFGSFLGETMAEYVRLKRTLGYRYNVNERMLLRFDRFLQHHADFVGKPLNQLVDLWAQDDPSPYPSVGGGEGRTTDVEGDAPR